MHKAGSDIMLLKVKSNLEAKENDDDIKISFRPSGPSSCLRSSNRLDVSRSKESLELCPLGIVRCEIQKF